MDDSEGEMIAPKLSTALVYIALIIIGFAGLFTFDSILMRILLGLLFVHGIACFIVTKSWRSFVVGLLVRDEVSRPKSNDPKEL